MVGLCACFSSSATRSIISVGAKAVGDMACVPSGDARGLGDAVAALSTRDVHCRRGVLLTRRRRRLSLWLAAWVDRRLLGPVCHCRQIFFFRRTIISRLLVGSWRPKSVLGPNLSRFLGITQSHVQLLPRSCEFAECHRIMHFQNTHAFLSISEQRSKSVHGCRYNRG